MKNKLTFAGLLLIGLISCKDSKTTIKPTTSDLTISVYASVKVVPEDYYIVYPSTAGILEEWFVDVGDTVFKNQLIAQIQNDNSELQVESAQLNNSLALEKYKGKANLLQNIKTQIAATKKQLVNDSVNFSRQENLKKQNIGTTAEFDAAQLKYELSKTNLSNLQQQYSQSKIELENAYMQSQKQLKIALSQLGDYGVKSIMNGKVFDINAVKGELVSAQKPIASIGSVDDFTLEMWIDEMDIAKIRIGQAIVIGLDAFPNEQFEGVVSKIYPEKNNANQSFKIEGKFTSAPKGLLSGLSGEANIIIEVIKNTLVIPQRFLSSDSTVITKQGVLAVKTGAKNFSDVEIISGIDSTTVIIDPTQND